MSAPTYNVKKIPSRMAFPYHKQCKIVVCGEENRNKKEKLSVAGAFSKWFKRRISFYSC